ncbi:12577_t:CDS:2 [Ambispora leptoticha]|uniref:12577_t:CDS:1 n=1 Tax=Ambispora leptoticha TaxID=144679 RepID=A0A9N8ZDL9_9GLOM|nr:12577_t:CDS:2 [Ambispora leptoticha]
MFHLPRLHFSVWFTLNLQVLTSRKELLKNEEIKFKLNHGLDLETIPFYRDLYANWHNSDIIDLLHLGKVLKYP